MVDTLLEGIRASIQPCSLALVLPGAGLTVLAGGRAPVVAAAFVLAATLSAWAQASLLLDITPGVISGVALGLSAAAGLALTLRGNSAAGRGRRQAALGGGLTGASAGLLWQPCVGPALGAILSAAPATPVATLGPMLIYMLGLLLVIAAFAAAGFVHPGVSQALRHPLARALAAAPVVLLVVVLLTGRYGQIIGELVRLSTLS